MEQDVSVRRQLLALQSMTLTELTEKWRDLFQRDPPEYGIVFMRRRLAHRIQELTYGGMSDELRAQLSSVNAKLQRRHTGLRPGTRIVRSWRDNKYEVTVCENGFEYAGQIFTSLSAVARTITGVNRNGYEFFGIKDRLNMIEKQIRCAIYTRKSTDEGLDMDFNSLDAQRESAEAFIASQKHRGWVCLKTDYSDGGFSGGNTDRPALQRLLDDIKSGKIDVVVVYKIDRLSRSLLDFASLQTVFDEHQVSFVSVTQDINTSTSSGRMMLNILMTFAQYEREIITERIKDKIGAAKKRGKFCGGSPVLGYDVEPTSKKLLVNPQEAETVRRIFQDYLKLGSARDVADSLERDGFKTKSRVSRRGRAHGGGAIDAALVYRTLTNPIYIGQIRHLEQAYPGEHEAIIPQKLWNQVQELLALHTVHDGKMEKRLNPFRGLIRCGYCNGPLSLSATQKSHGKHYQYYVCRKDLKRTRSECTLKRVPAAELEKLLMNEIAAMLATPTMTAHIQSAARKLSVNGKHLKPKQVNEAFRDLKTVWDVMFPGERYKFIHAIVKEVTITIDSVRIEYNVPGLEQILKEAGVEIDG